MSDPDIDHGPLDRQSAEAAFEPLTRDEHGRLVLSAADRADRGETLRRLFAEWATWSDDDPPGTSEQFLRNIDDERRRSGMRTLFEEYY